MGAGEAWKKKREGMGKSIDDMSTELRVAQRYLRAIEEGNWEGWPVRVFSTGFIRAYARKLSMDPEPVLSEYFRFVDEKAGSEPRLQVRPEWLEREKQRGSRRTIYLAAAGAVLLLGIVMAWYSTRTIPRPPGGAEIPLAQAPPAAVDNASPAPAAPSPDVAGGTQETGEPPPAATGDAAGRATAPYQLVLEAKERTWILYGRDDETPVDVTLQAGDRISIQARKKVYLKLGNAGGVTATLNGQSLPPFGEVGRVKVYRLGQ